MSLGVAAVLGAIRRVIEGKQGAVRVVDPGAFTYRANLASTEAAELVGLEMMPEQGASVAHRYDIRVSQDRDHAATPISNRSNRRIVLMPFVIDVASCGTKVEDPSSCDGCELEFRAAAIEDLHAVRKALTWPGNLDTNEETGESTGLMDGQLFGPNGVGDPVVTMAPTVVNGCMFARARIDCAAVIEELQEVA